MELYGELPCFCEEDDSNMKIKSGKANANTDSEE